MSDNTTYSMFNQFKTTILLALLTGLFLWAGYGFGGNTGLTMAFIFSVVFNIGTYWFSDTFVLKMYHAVPVSTQNEPKLYAIIRDLASRAYLPMPKVYIIDMPSPNAFATGRNPNHAAIAVSKSIMELLSENELRGVLAHEMGHIKNRDILISTIAATIAGALSYLTQISYYAGIFGGFGNEDENNNGGLISSILFIFLAPVIATILQLAISRTREFKADETGARMCRDPYSLASALAKLENYAGKMEPESNTAEAMSHVFIVNPFKTSLLHSLFSTHPPMSERIARLKAMRIQ